MTTAVMVLLLRCDNYTVLSDSPDCQSLLSVSLLGSHAVCKLLDLSHQVVHLLLVPEVIIIMKQSIIIIIIT